MQALGSRTSVGGAAGFSLLEVLVSTTVLMVILGVVFQATAPAQTAMLAEPERSDMQQRGRASVAVLGDDLRRAGGGTAFGSAGGTLNRVLAPIVPFRRGRRLADPVGTVRSDVVSVVRRADLGPHTTLATPLPAQSGSTTISLDPSCRVSDPACGFAAGMTVLVADASHHSFFSIVSVSGSTLVLTHNSEDSTHVFPTGETHIMEVVSRTYYLAEDAAGVFQLKRYDGDGGSDVPVVDHVVTLDFAYLGDADPPAMTQLRAAPAGPWTSYGPAPPLLGVQNTLYPPGESCVFSLDAGAQVPRLPRLAGGPLVPLDAAQLADGPWCPDEGDPNRFDADLLRIRAVDVRLVVEAVAATFRGPAGPLFTRAGTAPANRWLPDVRIDLRVSPRGVAGLP